MCEPSSRAGRRSRLDTPPAKPRLPGAAAAEQNVNLSEAPPRNAHCNSSSFLKPLCSQSGGETQKPVGFLKRTEPHLEPFL